MAGLKTELHWAKKKKESKRDRERESSNMAAGVEFQLM